MRIGLRLKLGLYVVLFVLGVLTLVGFLRVRSERDIYLEELRARAETLLRAFAIPAAVAMANNDTPTLDNYLVQFAEAAQKMDLAYMAVLDFGGKVVAHTNEGEFGRVYDDAFTQTGLKERTPTWRILADAHQGRLEMTVPIVSGLRWGTLRAGFTLSRMERDLRKRQHQLIVTALAVSGGAAIVAYLLLSRLVLAPVLRMRRMAARFGSGQLTARVELSSGDEMGELAEQLNGMAQQIQEYTDSLEKLVEERTSELAETNNKLLAANKQLEALAQTDPLTGLYNRRYFMEQLEFEMRRGQRTSHQCTVVMMDMDHFKHYNDTNGHTAGDELLQRLGALLESNTRGTDVVARYGGEEFIVLLLDTGPEEGFATAEKLRVVVEAEPMPHEEKQPLGKITVSVGVAFFPGDASDPRDLIERADQALYASKAAGRNRVTRYRDVR